MSGVIVSRGTADTERAGALLAALVEPGDVVALAGDLGAGKTCLVQGVAHGLGIDEAVTSPTFNILLVHAGRIPLYHFDLYRLERVSELEDIDFYETIEREGVAMIEWGDRFPDALPDDNLTVIIHRTDDDTRSFEVIGRGERARALEAAWLAACVAEGLA